MQSMRKCEVKYKEIFDQTLYSGLLKLADVKICTKDGCSFDVHKVILARCSDYFREKFYGLKEAKRTYKISGINGDCMSDILVFIYTKNISVNETNLKDLLFATDYFSIRHLYVKVQAYVKSTLTNANCLRRCLITYYLNNNEIFRNCLNFIIPRFEEIVKSQKSDFNDLPIELLKRILSYRNLCIRNESTIWQVIVQWVQACPEIRLQYVACLLSSLAIAEVSANLAKEIVNHDIVQHNEFTTALKNTVSLIGVDRACYAISDFIKDLKPNYFRIPYKLNLFSESHGVNMKIFISFDETTDFWYKIIEMQHFVSQKIIATETNVYFFHSEQSECLIFNVESMERKIVQNEYHTRIRSLFTIENTLYTIVCENEKYHIDIYDIEEEGQCRLFSLEDFNFPIISSTTIGQCIFIVASTGQKNPRSIVARVFNVNTHQWRVLTPPTKFHNLFELVSYHNKIYLIDKRKSCPPEVEVFDPAVNAWKVLPDLHDTYYNADLAILCDKLIIYDHIPDYLDSMACNAKLWNENEECWEILEKITTRGEKDFCCYQSCTINNTRLIKSLTKRNRNSNVKIEKIRFVL